jgi:L-lactate dehydrogenase complex protein LldG
VPPTDQRQEVFARIREALQVPAPHHHVAHGGDAHSTVEGIPASDAFRAWLPAVGDSMEERFELFAQNSAQLKTEVVHCASVAEASAHLASLAHENGWQQIATHQHPLALPLATTLAGTLARPLLVTDGGYAIADLEHCDASITGCDALVAQTGSILVSAPSAGGRALSVLPPHHIVVARWSQMVPDLTTALRVARERYAPNWPSFLSFITGPSRTGDIERILVLGAHGPKKLSVLVLP